MSACIHQDATQSMPPYDLWLAGRDDILHPGLGRAGYRNLLLRPHPHQQRHQPIFPPTANTNPPRPAATNPGPQVLELTYGTITELTFFLNTPTLFPLFGLPAWTWSDSKTTPTAAWNPRR